MTPPAKVVVLHPEKLPDDFFSAYLHYSSDTEVPINFHRWSIITSLGAFLGRQFFFKHGSFEINPNMYTMLIGSPGTRKSTAIKLVKKLITQSGYTTIAADKTSKEKFLLDISGEADVDPTERKTKSAEDFLAANLWGEEDTNSQPDCECFIMADELNDFMGQGNMEFISLLGSLWDYSGIYKNRIKSGKSVQIKNPTISILAGNTPVGFAQAFPSEILGQGFFSRILLIYGEPNGKRITFPTTPSEAATQSIVEYLRLIKNKVQGSATLNTEAQNLLDRIYRSDQRIDDIRFESYSNRRFTHLLKLSLICAGARISTEISRRDVIYANTILKHAEHFMPRALGEFGKSKNATVAHEILQLAHSTHEVLTFKMMWKHVNKDLEKMQDLSTILQNLVAADKLQSVPGGLGFLPKKKLLSEIDSEAVDFSLLTNEERKSLAL